MRGRIVLQKLRDIDAGLFISHEVLLECGSYSPRFSELDYG
jgi:hypothetical protein